MLKSRGRDATPGLMFEFSAHVAELREAFGLQPVVHRQQTPQGVGYPAAAGSGMQASNWPQGSYPAGDITTVAQQQHFATSVAAMMQQFFHGIGSIPGTQLGSPSPWPRGGGSSSPSPVPQDPSPALMLQIQQQAALIALQQQIQLQKLQHSPPGHQSGGDGQRSPPPGESPQTLQSMMSSMVQAAQVAQQRQQALLIQQQQQQQVSVVRDENAMDLDSRAGSDNGAFPTASSAARPSPTPSGGSASVSSSVVGGTLQQREIAEMMRQALDQGDIPRLEALIQQISLQADEADAASGSGAGSATMSRRASTAVLKSEEPEVPPGFATGGYVQNALFEDDPDY